MPLNDLVSVDAILPAMRVANKKAALQELSVKAGELSGLHARDIFDAVLQRERLGSTGVGNGIAIPHGKLSSCKSIFGVFGRLERPIAFEALDDAPVDLMFLLVAPEHAGADHLKALARIARALRDSRMVGQIRAARDAASLYGVLTRVSTPNAA